MKRAFFIFAMFLGCGVFPAHAMDLSGCDRTEFSNVPFTLESIGDVSAAKVVEEGDQWRVIIDLNFRYNYLSAQTIQWLVFRACFFAHEQISETQSQDLYQAENADCWAARQLSRLGFSDLDIQTVEYDLEVINKQVSGSDFRGLLGPQRSPYLRKCL